MRLLLAAALLIAAGCIPTHSSAVPEDPAYIVRATPESRAALRQAVERSLETQITLDDEALTHDSILVVDRAERADLGHAALTRGQDPRAPGAGERFHLVRVLDHCVLVHDRTDRHFDLPGTICAPM
jgi:hypothetical protein